MLNIFMQKIANIKIYKHFKINIIIKLNKVFFIYVIYTFIIDNI